MRSPRTRADYWTAPYRKTRHEELEQKSQTGHLRYKQRCSLSRSEGTHAEAKVMPPDQIAAVLRFLRRRPAATRSRSSNAENAEMGRVHR